jgi:hypothetical protein
MALNLVGHLKPVDRTILSDRRRTGLTRPTLDIEQLKRWRLVLGQSANDALNGMCPSGSTGCLRTTTGWLGSSRVLGSPVLVALHKSCPNCWKEHSAAAPSTARQVENSRRFRHTSAVAVKDWIKN